jgi:hypothetical protein
MDSRNASRSKSGKSQKKNYYSDDYDTYAEWERKERKRSAKSLPQTAAAAAVNPLSAAAYPQAYSYPYVGAEDGAGAGTLEEQDWTNQPVDWFQWVVCYQEGEDFGVRGREPGSYYVLNKVTGQSRWLTDHVDEFLRNTLLPCEDWSDYALQMSLALPTSLLEAMMRGWSTYYDRAENVCKWISIPTKSVEVSLPLGYGEYASSLEELNLVACTESSWSGNEFAPGEGAEHWYFSDQSCAEAWVLVVVPQEPVVEDVEDAEVWPYYYLNRTTAETRWTPPEGWDLLLSKWGYWTLCCSEEAIEQLYWYVDGPCFF